MIHENQEYKSPTNNALGVLLGVLLASDDPRALLRYLFALSELLEGRKPDLGSKLRFG